jgi:hypothetical protein
VVVHPAVVLTVVLAWLGLLAVLAGAVLFGQTARSAPRPRRPRPRSSRVGLFVSLSGPWLAVLLAAGAGALTGRWLAAAAVGACAVALVAIVGVTLHPH